MNPVSLTMHTAAFIFCYVVYLIAPGWDPGLFGMCMTGLALIGAVSVGAFRKHDVAMHQARGQASIDEASSTGQQMRARLLMLDKRVRTTYTAAVSVVDRMYAGVSVGAIAIGAAIVVLMGSLPFMGR